MYLLLVEFPFTENSLDATDCSFCTRTHSYIEEKSQYRTFSMSAVFSNYATVSCIVECYKENENHTVLMKSFFLKLTIFER